MPVNRTQPCSRHWTRISALLGFLLLVASQASCSQMSTTPSPVAKVSAPEQCLASPDPLPLLAEGSMEALVRHVVLLAAEWHDLRIRHACLAEFERLR